jgi:hypothetical protein
MKIGGLERGDEVGFVRAGGFCDALRARHAQSFGLSRFDALRMAEPLWR